MDSVIIQLKISLKEVYRIKKAKIQQKISIVDHNEHSFI